MAKSPQKLGVNALPRGGLRRWLNALLEWTKLRTTLTAGAGIVITDNETGRVIAASKPSPTLDLEGVITAVHTQGTPPHQAGSVTYSAVARYRPTATLDDVAPKYGRPCSDEGAVFPAAVGDRCWIVRERQDDGSIVAELQVLSEKLAVSAECG